MEQLEHMREVDIRTVNPKELRDIREVSVNTDGDKDKRTMDFIEQIGNPYCFKYGDYMVKVSFTGSVSLTERLREFVDRMAYGQL